MITNTTYRILVEKLGDSDPNQFVGNEGEIFYDPSTPAIYLSDGTSSGGVTIGGGGGLDSGWTPTTQDTHTTKQVIIGNNTTAFTENLVVEGNARVTGILSVGTATIVLDPSQNTIAIGTAITLNANESTILVGGSVVGDSTGNANYVGVVTATSLVVGEEPVSGTDVQNWNTAYGWGNHADAGYLTSFTETDPLFASAVISGIGSTNIDNWNTAYGWGDHSTEGYLKSLDYVATAGISTVAENLTGNPNITVTDIQVNGDINVNGNLSVAGTSVVISASTLMVSDKDIVLGNTTNPTDNTANHGGISIASTEGSPLMSLQAVGINSLPDTYKQIMWMKSGTFVGLNTDAWLFNYAVGIGTVQIPSGVRLAIGGVHITDNEVSATTFTGTLNGSATYATTAGVSTTSQGLTGTPNITVGVVSATSFVGDASGLTGFGVSQTSNIGLTTYSSPHLALTNYNGANSRVFEHVGILTQLNWTANFQNLNLQNNQATTVRILGSVGGSEVNLSAVQIDGTTSGVTSYGLPLKGIKNKTGSFILTIVRSTGSNYRVYGESANFV